MTLGEGIRHPARGGYTAWHSLSKPPAILRRLWAGFFALACVLGGPRDSLADTAPGATPPAPASRLPVLVGAQYTFIMQWQSPLHAPYSGRLSLKPGGDRQPTETIGLYGGWAPVDGLQLYLDTEKFMGAGVSGATGLGGLTNGEVVHAGSSGLHKTFYIARLYARYILPLGSDTVTMDRAQDQIPGTEPATGLELKVGRMAASDDFDQNRYAGSARTEFMDSSLWQNTAWDYAANTRGYSDGIVVGYISPGWSLKYGIYRMPLHANGQALERSLSVARGENLELTLSPWKSGTVLHLLAYRNTARMGDYSQALGIAAAGDAIPDIAADDRNGRQKYGLGVNIEQPLADDGATGMFMRVGWNDGHTETFAFTEVDRVVSSGAQLSGVHWRRPADRLGVAFAVDGLSAPHREYLAEGGCGFVLCDGRLDYGYEQIVETYYRAQWTLSLGGSPVRLQVGPDAQFIRNPGYNRDRGPVSFWAVRLHLEY